MKGRIALIDKERYWNPIIETLPREKFQKLQLKKFQNIFKWAYEYSKFYRKLYSEAGIEPGDIKSLEDVQKVPKIEKPMMRTIQGEDPYPYGDMLCVPLEKVTTYHQTSGTTGQPIYQPETWQDWEWYSETWACVLHSHGFRDYDRVFVPFSYNVFIAWWGAHYAAEKIGCEVIPGGGLNTEARILKMRDLRATAFVATPTYVLAMADTAKTKLGIDPAKDLQVSKITVGGEPGGSILATRKRMEEAWGAKVYDAAGTCETGTWSYECLAQCGLHINEALFLVELEDVNTGEPLLQPGRVGNLVVTAFDRMAQPCIRFNTKDLAEWSAEEQCECGRTFRLLKGGILGRSDDMTKVKGVLLGPTVIEEIVRGSPQLGDEFEVIVVKKGDRDDITLKVELIPEYKGEKSSVEEELMRELRIKTNLRFNLEFHDYGSLPRYEMKSKRFKDLRGKQ